MRPHTQLLLAATVLFLSPIAASAQETAPTAEPAPQVLPAPVPTTVPSPTLAPVPTPAKPLKPAKVIDSLGDFAIAPADQPLGCIANRFYSASGDGGKIVCDTKTHFLQGFKIASKLKQNCNDVGVGPNRKYECTITD